jgi:hypothetical protein
MRRFGKPIAIVAAAAAFSAWSSASAAIKEPDALVAASFDLTAQQPYVQGACPAPNLYDALYIHLLGTETDSSNPPHPELTGNLEATVVTYLSALGSKASAGTVKATLTDDAGQILWAGRGNFAGSVTNRNTVVASGLLTAKLFESGVPTDHMLIASFTFEQSLFDYNITGQFGQASTLPTFAIETAGVCPAAAH